jgi:hypothetical protein
MSTEIERDRREVFETIYGVKTFSEVLKLFKSDYKKVKNKGIRNVQELYRNYSYAIFYMYSPSTIRNNLVKFKNAIKSGGGKYRSNALEAFSVENVYAPIRKEEKEPLEAKKEAVRSGTNEKIDPQSLIIRILAFQHALDSGSYEIKQSQKEKQVRAYHIVAMLGLATGRRFTELMKTLIISKRGSKITFDGLLKGNNEKIEGNIIGLSYSDVKKYLKELREYSNADEMTAPQVNAKYAKVFNSAMKRLGVENVKSTRHDYSVAGSQLFKREHESIEDTITRILGHREIFVSALNYT